jgi:xylulokinase
VLLGLDLGTGSAKAVLLSANGRIIGQGTAEYAVRSPRPGWAESNPGDWWHAAVVAVREALDGRGDTVQALGLSGQMHGVVLSTGDGTPLRPAVLWADTRSSSELATYKSLGPEAQRRLGNPYVAGMAGPTLLWLRDHEPDSYTAARWALQPKDWLRLRLTGSAAADPSDASATLLYDLIEDDWAFSVGDALGLRADLLAPILPSAAPAGTLTARAAEHLGLAPGTPVAAGAGDTAAAALGTGLLSPGSVQLTVGTGGQIVAPLDAPRPDPTFRTHLYRAVAPRSWYAMAAIQNAGVALEWVRAVLGVTWQQVYAEAFAVPPGADGLTFLPYLTGERTPHLDPAASGAWAGLRLHHSRGHLLRAALEGVAHALRDGLEALEDRGIEVPELRLAGGGTAEPPWRQLLADVLGRPLLAFPESAASARGAALLAGIAIGLYRDAADTLQTAPTPQPVAHPGPSSPLYGEAYKRYRALYPRLRGWPDDAGVVRR